MSKVNQERGQNVRRHARAAMVQQWPTRAEKGPGLICLCLWASPAPGTAGVTRRTSRGADLGVWPGLVAAEG